MGSSPLTRGKRHALRSRLRDRGLIPAHAGKTPRRPASRPRYRAHPRSRGENRRWSWTRGPCGGSSPLTRGKPAVDGDEGVSRGLIPAHAGKTSQSCSRAARRGAHPRSRGENFCSSIAAACAAGSSPLTRGKQLRVVREPDDDGLIPAHAGKTPHGPTSGRYSGAHPRSRGENPGDAHPDKHTRGSSPLTRGKRVAARVGPADMGLIPAHAGKTVWSTCPSRLSRAHPRSRGENTSVRPLVCRNSGSSPLTRGKPGRPHCLVACRGLIPAHAGKTLSSSPLGVKVRAHPRSRGENELHGKS